MASPGPFPGLVLVPGELREAGAWGGRDLPVGELQDAPPGRNSGGYSTRHRGPEISKGTQHKWWNHTI
jgi:hypothetical protein